MPKITEVALAARHRIQGISFECFLKAQVDENLEPYMTTVAALQLELISLLRQTLDQQRSAVGTVLNDTSSSRRESGKRVSRLEVKAKARPAKRTRVKKSRGGNARATSRRESSAETAA